ncbi:hypothetical protein Tco_0582818 [Tanacetum coccineum]
MNSNLASTSYSQPELPRFITNPHNNDTRSVDELARDKAGEDNDLREDNQQSGGDYSEDEEGDNEEARSGYPNFTLDVVLKSTGPALLALPSTETIASPAIEVMDVPTSSNTSASDTKKDNMKDQTDNPESKKISVKRGLFQETETGAKKPRQDK